MPLFERGLHTELLESLSDADLEAHFVLAGQGIAALLERQEAGGELDGSALRAMGFFRREQQHVRAILTKRGVWQEESEAPVIEQTPLQEIAWADTSEGEAWLQSARLLRVAESLSELTVPEGIENLAEELAGHCRADAIAAFNSGNLVPEVTVPELERIAATLQAMPEAENL